MTNRLSKSLAMLMLTALPLAPIGSQAATDVSAERPLGRLFTPLPTTDTSRVLDVYSQKPPTPVLSPTQATTPPPLGVLLNPLADGDQAKTASPLPTTSGANLQGIQTPAAASMKTGSDVSGQRPLGLLLDQTSFAPDPQYLSNAPAEKEARKTASKTPIYAPAPLNWDQSGANGDRPLGTLLMPGTYRRSSPPDQPSSDIRPLTAVSTVAQPDQVSTAQEEPAVNFSADEMSFDRENGAVRAAGNVEVSYQDRTLSADEVIYNRNTNEVIALGNVVIQEPTRETVYGDKIEISGDLKDGVILNIGIILQDRSRIAGASATRSGGVKTQLNHAVYSPCSLCEDDPNKPPVWQIKAVNVTHDKNAKTVEYEDAWLEFFGVPVFYTPYFRHPDPTVKRKSGFLFPTFGNSSDLGTIIHTPIFWNIAPNEDATITPILMTAENPILAVEYRNLQRAGQLTANGSLTASPGDAVVGSAEEGRYGMRGHIESEGRFDINQAWRWGFDGNWTSDDTYLRRYGFASPSTLKSQIYTESFKGQNYFSLKALSFQSLQDSVRSETIPVVLPLADFNYIGDKDRLGGTTNFDFNFLALTREEGLDTRRLSARSRWQRPFIGKLGDVYNVSFGLNSDFYHVNELVRGANTSNFDGFSYRLTPEAALEWRMPFEKSDGKISQVIEPIASFIWSPYGGNSRDIPNEDSIELEFDDTNLFRTNRFSGLDRVEGGPRTVYGLKWGAFGADGGKTNVFVGQSWRPKKDDAYAEGSGLENNFSDVVARVQVAPGPHLKASYRTRLSQEDLQPKRHEFNASGGIPALTIGGNYTFLERQAGSEFPGREELSMVATSQIDRYWRTGFNGTRDIDAGEMRSAGMYLTYEDECLVFTSKLSRTFFQDRDLEPTDSITFNLVFKTLGEVKTGGSVF